MEKTTKEIVVFDLETTGADVGKDEICQFAAVVTNVQTGQILKTLEFICKPSIPIEQGAEEVHGISNETVANAPPFKDFAPSVISLMDCPIIAGYNIASFDVPILNRQLEKCGHLGFFDNKIILDAFEIFKLHNTRTLADACKWYGVPANEKAHDALSDVKATLNVLVEQIKQEQKTEVEVAEMSFPLPDKRVGITKHIILDEKGQHILNFSQKHKGKPLAQIDKGFLEWILKNDFPDAVKKCVERHI